MNSSEFGLKQFFSAPASGLSQVISSALDVSIKAVFLREVPRIGWAQALSGVVEKLDDLLNIRVIDIMAFAWNKYGVLRKYLDKEKYPANEPIFVPLAEHTIKSDHHPFIEILVDDKSLAKLEFTINVTFKLKGVVLKIQGGRIKEIRTGEIRAEGSVKYGDFLILSKEAGSIGLPGSIDLGEGIAIDALRSSETDVPPRPTGEARLAGKVFRIGYLASASPGAGQALSPLWEAFREGLRAYGWIDGQNMSIEARYSEGRPERLADLAADLTRLKVDLLFAPTASPARAAKQATTRIPIVTIVSDPVGIGLVASLDRPGGNITGLSSPDFRELTVKRLGLIKEAIPHVSRVAFLLNWTLSHREWIWRDAEAAARALGLNLRAVPVRGPEDFEPGLAGILKEGADALFVYGDPLPVRHRGQIVDFTAKHRLPAMYDEKFWVDIGGLMSCGASWRDLYRRAATYVDKLLKGANPADLPVEQATKFDMFINLNTATALGLAIPQSVLSRADEVIQ